MNISESDHSEKHSSLGTLFVLIGTFFFAAKGIVIKFTYALGMTAAPLLMLRFAFALPFYLIAIVWISKRETSSLTRSNKCQIFGLGVIGYYLSSLLDFWGLEFITASLERLVLYLYPTIVVLIVSVERKKFPRASLWFALLLTYVGIFLVLATDISAQQELPTLILGALLVFASCVCFSIYVVYSGKIIPKVGATKFTSLAMLSASFGVLVHNFLKGNIHLLIQPMSMYACAMVLAFFCTVIPSYFMSAGIKYVGSERTAFLGMTGPVFTLIMGAVILNEILQPIQWLGALLVLTGVLFVNRLSK